MRLHADATQDRHGPESSIGDGAIVSAGSVVLKDTKIGPGEIWGGVPAKRIK